MSTGFANWLEFVAPHLIGWVPYAAIWFVLFHKFQLANDHSTDPAPKWVFGFYWFNVGIFSSFGFNQTLQMRRLFKLKLKSATEAEDSMRRIAVQHELAYVCLSVSAKVVTAIFLFTGMLANKSAGSLEHTRHQA
jgi:hypothetical protein